MRVDALKIPHCSDQSSQLWDGVREGSRVCTECRCLTVTRLKQCKHQVGNEVVWDRTKTANVGRLFHGGVCVYILWAFLKPSLQIHKNLQTTGKILLGRTRRITSESNLEILLQGPKATTSVKSSCRVLQEPGTSIPLVSQHRPAKSLSEGHAQITWKNNKHVFCVH